MRVEVVITTPYCWASPGHRLYGEHTYAARSAAVRRFETSFADYRARLALSQAGRPMWAAFR